MLWFPGLADRPAMEDKEVREVPPFFPRCKSKQVLLDLHGVFVLREPEPVCKPLHMGVHGNALIDAEGAGEDDVRGLARHAGQRRKLLHGLWDRAVELFQEQCRGLVDVFRLVVEKINGAYVLREPFRRGVRVILDGPVFPEQALRNLVHEHVRGLGREHGRHEQLQGAGEPERRLGRVRVLLVQPLDDLQDFLAVVHAASRAYNTYCQIFFSKCSEYSFFPTRCTKRASLPGTSPAAPDRWRSGRAPEKAYDAKNSKAARPKGKCCWVEPSPLRILTIIRRVRRRRGGAVGRHSPGLIPCSPRFHRTFDSTKLL